MILYHGTWNAPTIIRQGFSLARVGENKGNFGALGIGVYFTTSYEIAKMYGSQIILAEIEEQITGFKGACVLAGLSDIPADDPFALWEAVESKRWAERISKKMLGQGIKVVKLRDEVCVYDPTLILIKDWEFAWSQEAES